MDFFKNFVEKFWQSGKLSYLCTAFAPKIWLRAKTTFEMIAIGTGKVLKSECKRGEENRFAELASIPFSA